MFSKSQEYLLEKFADHSDRLFEMGVIRTDSFTGEIGEYIACRIFDLTITEKVTQAVDGISKYGEKYQIKSKIITDKFNYNITGLESKLFDFLVIVYFDSSYKPLTVLRIPSQLIINNEISVSNSNINMFEHIDINRLSIETNIQNTIKDFAQSYNELIHSGIIRSRKVVGDIGEFYACKRLNLILPANKNEKGLDARHPNGLTFEIKTRRVYESGRRKSETRRIKNIIGKSADYLIVVTLDRAFRCSGMWLLPMKNIINPKSAKLQLVNSTLGTNNLIPSRIPWLFTGEAFQGFDKLISYTIISERTDFMYNKLDKNYINKTVQVGDRQDLNRISPKSTSSCVQVIAILFGISLILVIGLNILGNLF